MSLTIYNGSPRGKNSNSSHIINWFLSSYDDASTIEPLYLNKKSHRTEADKHFETSSSILCVFPLYVDGMPGQVKYFFEQLTAFKGQCVDKRIVFIIHSGFSEAIQSRALERYLHRLCDLLAINERTIVIIPGSEGFRLMPDSMTKKKRLHVASLGADFAAKKPLNKKSVHWLQKSEVMSPITLIFFRLSIKLGLSNMYWNQMLKSNKVYEQRFNAPYKDTPIPITSKGAYLTNHQ